jgi:hypothetical protein
MKIAEFLREDLILPELRSTDKASVLREICEVIARRNPQLDAARLTEVLLEREKLGSTGVGDGIAIPPSAALAPGSTSRPSTASRPTSSSCSSPRRTRRAST